LVSQPPPGRLTGAARKDNVSDDHVRASGVHALDYDKGSLIPTVDVSRNLSAKINVAQIATWKEPGSNRVVHISNK
jgi:hypothetical protein